MTLKKFILGFWITISTIVQIGQKRFKEVKFTKPSTKFYVLLIINICGAVISFIHFYCAYLTVISYLELGLHFDTIDNISPNKFIWLTVSEFIMVYVLLRLTNFFWDIMPLDELLKEAGNYETLTFLQARRKEVEGK